MPGFWARPSFLDRQFTAEQIAFYRVTTQTEGRPNVIANELYGSEEYEWILLAFNDVVDTLTWPKSGSVIRYPKKKAILTDLT